MSNVRPESMARITNFELANAFIDEQVKLVREQVGDKKVLLALSGGVDSSVVAALLIKAIGKQLVCVHVNHGLMRKNESEGVIMKLLHTFARFYAYYDTILCVGREEPVIFEYLGDPNLAPGFLAALGIKEAEIPTFGQDIPYTMWHPLNCTKKPGYLGITLE